MMEQMSAWARHANEHVRRLASEGCRPRLPWGQALPRFQKDPSPVLAILEQLKADPSLYVRKSVANNLNDISKNHPELVARIARDWYGRDERTDWIVKHACRFFKRCIFRFSRSSRTVVFSYSCFNCSKDFSMFPETEDAPADYPWGSY